jgi:hypothetical protein
MKKPTAAKGIPKPRKNDRKAVRAPEFVRSQPLDACPSCGKEFVNHLGIIGTCAKVETARTALFIIETAALMSLEVKNLLDAKNIRKLCRSALYQIRP